MMSKAPWDLAHSFIHSANMYSVPSSGLGRQRQVAAHKHTVGLDASAIGTVGQGRRQRRGGQDRPQEEVTPELRRD